MCAGEENCEEVNFTETRCVPRLCVPDSTSCGEGEEATLRCDDIGRSWEIIERCEEGSRCALLENEHSCTPLICVANDTRCDGSTLQRCNRGVTWRDETCPQRFICGIDEGAAVCVQTECGNSVLEAGEECDDGGTVTELCRYGDPACVVCDATCRLIEGTARFCGYGLIRVR